MNEFCTFFIPELKKVKINDIEAVPLATTAAPIGRGVNGIMVQTDFTVGRS